MSSIILPFEITIVAAIWNPSVNHVDMVEDAPNLNEVKSQKEKSYKTQDVRRVALAMEGPSETRMSSPDKA